MKLNAEAITFQKNMTTGWKFKMGMLYKLPSVMFWGIRVKNLSNESCKVTIPYTWRTQNPFQSIYFAALAGAGELATGALCQLHLKGRGKWSMLVVDLRAEFHKKANSKITFKCDQGEEIYKIFNEIERTMEPQQLTMVAKGRNDNDEIVSNIFVTWSFKKKA